MDSNCEIALKAIRSKDSRTLARILEKEPNLQEDISETTLLIEAVLQGNSFAINLLLDKGMDINRGSPSLVSPLCAAAAANRLEVAKLLIERGCDVSKMTDGRPMYTTTTALHYAIMARNTQMIQLLLDHGHDPNYPSNYRIYPLLEAIEQNSPVIVDMLIKSGKCALDSLGEKNVYCRWDHPPLYQAIFKYKRYELAKILLDTKECSLKFDFDSYLSILLTRAFDTHLRVVKMSKMLLEAGCDIECTDRFGRYPFTTLLNANIDVFKITPVLPVMKLLIGAGIYPNEDDLLKLRLHVTDEKEDLFCDIVTNLTREPKSLIEQCRHLIRKKFTPFPKESINSLPLPSTILGYLTFENIS